MWLLEIVALLGALLCGLALGGRGKKRNMLINYGIVLMLGSSIWLIILNWEIGIWLFGLNFAVLYSLAFFLNRRYGGLDNINEQVTAEKIIKNIQKKSGPS
jgi:hypothetical protein